AVLRRIGLVGPDPELVAADLGLDVGHDVVVALDRNARARAAGQGQIERATEAHRLGIADLAVLFHDLAAPCYASARPHDDAGSGPGDGNAGPLGEDARSDEGEQGSESDADRHGGTSSAVFA